MAGCPDCGQRTTRSGLCRECELDELFGGPIEIESDHEEAEA